MHRLWHIERSWSRGTNSRRWIAAPDFRLRGDAPSSERPPAEGRPAAAAMERCAAPRASWHAAFW